MRAAYLKWSVCVTTRHEEWTCIIIARTTDQKIFNILHSKTSVNNDPTNHVNNTIEVSSHYNQEATQPVHSWSLSTAWDTPSWYVPSSGLWTKSPLCILARPAWRRQYNDKMPACALLYRSPNLAWSPQRDDYYVLGTRLRTLQWTQHGGESNPSECTHKTTTNNENAHTEQANIHFAERR